MRTETALNLVIVLVIAVDAFVGLQVYQQQAEVPVPLALPATVGRPAAAQAAGPTGTVNDPEGGDTAPAAVVAARDVATRYSMQNAVLSTALAFVENGVMPADSFAIQALVPGASFVDGVSRATVGIIGVERTDTTVLFVAAESEDSWICASIDGNAQTTVYGRGETRASVSSFSKCLGPSDGWST